MDDDEPIVLGAPPQENEFVMPAEEPAYSEFESEPAYLGEVNEAPSMDDQPILLMGPSGSDDEMPMEMENTSDEPSPMQKWSAEYQETLKDRKDAENACKAELLEAARVELELFASQREQKRESNMSTNREDEQAKLEAIEADLENDNSWQRVCKMVELSHDSTAKAEDVKRMRDVMIMLKNDQTRAQTLSV